MNWGTFKALLTDALIDHLQPIQVQILNETFAKIFFLHRSDDCLICTYLHSHSFFVYQWNHYNP